MWWCRRRERGVEMVSEWVEDRFGNLVLYVSEKSPAKDTNIDTYISTENMLADFGGVTSASTLPRSGSVTRFRIGDTLFSNIRTYFKKVWQAKFDGCCSNDVVVFRSANLESLLPDYLHHVCRWEKFTELSIRTSKGAKMPRGDKESLANFQLRVPPLPDQRAIAHILGTLDDKIEINRKQNETLEAMARALFKAWFVDFEPVRAKQEGRWLRGQSLPGLPAHFYDLFPDRLVESELGEIPEGWNTQNVGDIGTIICGKTPSTKVSEYYGNDVPFITIPEMHGKIFAMDIEKRISYAGASSQKNKMLPQGAICVSCIATLGLVVITTEPSQTNQQINSVIPAEKDTIYYWYWALRNLGNEIKAGGSGGTVLGNLNTGHFSKLKVIASSRKLRCEYQTIVEALFFKIIECTRESRSLAQLRDTLLPKLISGELRVQDAEGFLKERGL